MKAKSFFSTQLDPYRAGMEIGEALADIEPEIIFLFPTIHYKGSPELTEALYDALDCEAGCGDKEPVLIGNTGDGFYELKRVAATGVSAMAINSGGAVKWHLAHESNLGNEPYLAAKQCVERLNRACGPNGPSLYYLATDFRTDSSSIIAALQENISVPLVGGAAGDNDTFQNCYVYANREVLTDSIALLAMEGIFRFDISIAHNLQPTGREGKITGRRGTTVHTMDNIPAMDFIQQELGKPLDNIDAGIITFKLKDKPDTLAHQIRSLLLPEDQSQQRAVKLLGGVQEGNIAQVCLAPADRIISDITDIVGQIHHLPFKPVAALIVSCAGRKRVLSDNIQFEVREIVKGCPSLKALAGFPSFGEFGPVKCEGVYSPPFFHNMTFILLLLGA